MRTLGEIIEAVKNGEKPEYDELRYALCALDSLHTFDSTALRNLAEAELENKKQILVYRPTWQYEESFNRNKRALSKTPKEWLGWNNDPDNPDYIKRRKAGIKIMENIIRKSKE